VLVGHSAGADAVILSLFDQIQSGNGARIKMAVLLDPSLTANLPNQQRTDISGEAQVVNDALISARDDSRHRLFMAASQDDVRSDAISFPSGDVDRGSSGYHLNLAVDVDLAQRMVEFFKQK
jgi:hypothetical protein